ncbi:unnamed protein product [Didymodactylos carnosus]|uniref:Integrase catalytic domain-containing protein n=1 Tax=Didymodactylos carnosus TaxID=1234261 RepID=A0A8S2S0G9_9BILA|nr:unnamed protein product [Didymodactylos carnosus]CAF4195367.1 unnamed protein product [Didymodactylos carnosus]
MKNYSTIAEPLQELTRGNGLKPFVWTVACQKSFDELKNLLMSAPIVSYPRFDLPFILQSDASDYGLGAVLAQQIKGEDGIEREHVIGYASRTLSDVERRYSIPERECLAVVWACTHFRAYIEGVKVKVLTDHKALKWLQNTKDLSSRLARWAMRLAAHDLDIGHRPGVQNANADALSRYPLDETKLEIGGQPAEEIIPISLFNINLSSSLSLLQEIKNAQWEDKDLIPILNFLQNQSLSPNPGLHKKITALAQKHRVIDGVLYRIYPSPINTHSNIQTRDEVEQRDDNIFHFSLQKSRRELLVIPRSKIIDMLQMAHDHGMSAHLGRRKTTHRLASRVTWPGMRQDIANYVRACKLCQQFKPENKKPAGLMQPNLVLQPWTVVGIDITGPLPKTRRGNTYILVVIDYFTKWVELFPLSSTKAKIIAQIFTDEVICRYGLPLKIISDNGAQFVSNVFKSVCDILQIKHRKTSLYHPQTNLSERVNRSIKPILAAYSFEDQRTWDIKLQQIAFAFRTIPSESTEETPAFLNFGRHPRQPLDLLINRPISTLEDTPTAQQITQYRKQLLSTLLPAYSIVREMLEIAHKTQTETYNNRRRPLSFEEGDLVWMTAISGITMGKWRGKKLAPRNEGPFRITQKLSPLTYYLQHTITHKKIGPIHIERLKQYYSF